MVQEDREGEEKDGVRRQRGGGEGWRKKTEVGGRGVGSEDREGEETCYMIVTHISEATQCEALTNMSNTIHQLGHSPASTKHTDWHAKVLTSHTKGV
jgi:hypothetical protein